MAEDYKLIDNEEKHRYEFQIDGKIAEIDYIKSNNGEIYLVHTEVPASLGGKGVGSQLAEKALADIERQGLRLVPLCPFVAGYIHKHPNGSELYCVVFILNKGTYIRPDTKVVRVITNSPIIILKIKDYGKEKFEAKK